MGIFKTLRTFATGLFVILNVLAILFLCVTGYAGVVNPAQHPSCEMLTLLFPIPLLLNVAFMLFWVLVRPRMVLLPIAGLVLCLPSVRAYCPFNLSEDAPRGSVKVLTYNVCCFAHDMGGDGTPSQAADYIVRQQADIVCLQEYSALPKDSLCTRMLTEAYPYNDSIHQPGKESLAVFSRYPILWHEVVAVGSSFNLCGAFYLEVWGDTVMVVNCHLESTKLSANEKSEFNDFVKRKTDTIDEQTIISKLTHSAARRALQVEEVSQYVECHPGMSIILCGDINDTPVSYAHRVLTRHLNDCHTATGLGPGFTMRRDGIYVRIDNILCSENLEPYACKIDTKAEYSDHYPMVCSLKPRQKTKK